MSFENGETASVEAREDFVDSADYEAVVRRAILTAIGRRDTPLDSGMGYDFGPQLKWTTGISYAGENPHTPRPVRERSTYPNYPA